MSHRLISKAASSIDWVRTFSYHNFKLFVAFTL